MSSIFDTITDAPSILYKYRSWADANQKRILTQLELYLPSPMRFNDPFDSIVPFTPTGTSKDIRTRISEDISAAHKNMPRKQRKSLAEEWFKKGIFKNKNLQLDMHLQRLKSQYGVFSLSEEYNNLLLWSRFLKLLPS